MKIWCRRFRNKNPGGPTREQNLALLDRLDLLLSGPDRNRQHRRRLAVLFATARKRGLFRGSLLPRWPHLARDPRTVAKPANV